MTAAEAVMMMTMIMMITTTDAKTVMMTGIAVRRMK